MSVIEKTKDVRPPRGFARLLWRAPIKLYRAGLGWLLGNRFLHLIHTGRKSGQQRHVVVEVVRHDPTAGIYIIAAGFGEKTDWLQNLAKTPQAEIEVGRKRMAVNARRLSVPEAEDELLDYGHRYPTAIRALGKFLGYTVETSDAGYRALGQVLPVVKLTVTKVLS